MQALIQPLIGSNTGNLATFAFHHDFTFIYFILDFISFSLLLREIRLLRVLHGHRRLHVLHAIKFQALVSDFFVILLLSFLLRLGTYEMEIIIIEISILFRSLEASTTKDKARKQSTSNRNS